METSAKNSTIVNSLFTEVVKEMNFKSNSHHSHLRKEKKKFKKFNNMTTMSSSCHNDTQNSITFSHKKIIASKQNKSSARFSSFCCLCCCCRDSFSPRGSVNSSNDLSKPDRVCSILQSISNMSTHKESKLYVYTHTHIYKKNE